MEDQVRQMKNKIGDLNSVRNTLHEKMADQEREIHRLKHDKTQLDT